MSLRLPASERRGQLLAIATQVFGAQGFHRTSMNDVAESAGVTKPVLYQHFESKRDLYLALLEECGAHLVEVIATATGAADSPQAMVYAGVRAYFGWVAEHTAAFQLLFGGGRRDDEFSEVIGRVEELIADAIAPLITAGIDEQHQRLLAFGIIGLAETISRRLVADNTPFDIDQVAGQVTDLVWAGLRAVHPR